MAGRYFPHERCWDEAVTDHSLNTFFHEADVGNSDAIAGQGDGLKQPDAQAENGGGSGPYLSIELVATITLPGASIRVVNTGFRWARWAERLSRFSCHWEFRAGTNNVADLLSENSMLMAHKVLCAMNGGQHV